MNRKRLEHAAGILRDIGLAALLGGVGDAAVNPDSSRLILDVFGMCSGVALLTASTWISGLDPGKGRS